MLIPRPLYLERLIRLRDKQIIKAITGVRRCGKSTLLKLFGMWLQEQGVAPERIVHLNLEAGELDDVLDHRALYREVASRMQPGMMNYVFLDEVQRVTEFEKAVDALFVRDDCDLYITGSNAYMLSGELATFLGGRYMEIPMLPLSFAEFMSAQAEGMSPERGYAQYLRRSSFPFALQLDSQEDVDRYLEDVYNTILIKDVLARRAISDVDRLKRVTRFLLDNIGNLSSFRKITDTMVSDGARISRHTVEDYVEGLAQSFAFYPARPYDVKGKELLRSGAKYYVVDVGLRSTLLADSTPDRGHILENVVYLELLRRGYHVYVGRTPKGEIDFVAKKAGITEFYQVAYTVVDAAGATLSRELAPLDALSHHGPKFLLTMDWDAPLSHNGIRQLNVLEWLLGEP